MKKTLKQHYAPKVKRMNENPWCECGKGEVAFISCMGCGRHGFYCTDCGRNYTAKERLSIKKGAIYMTFNEWWEDQTKDGDQWGTLERLAAKDAWEFAEKQFKKATGAE